MLNDIANWDFEKFELFNLITWISWNTSIFNFRLRIFLENREDYSIINKKFKRKFLKSKQKFRNTKLDNN